MCKAEQLFTKLAQGFEDFADREVAKLQSNVDAYNKNVRDKTLQYSGTAAGIGAGGGGLYGATSKFLRGGSDGKVLKGALRSGAIGAGLLGAGALGYLLPKALKSRVSRGEERQLTKALDAKHDVMRSKVLSQAFRNFAERNKTAKHYGNKKKKDKKKKEGKKKKDNYSKKQANLKYYLARAKSVKKVFPDQAKKLISDSGDMKTFLRDLSKLEEKAVRSGKATIDPKGMDGKPFLKVN